MRAHRAARGAGSFEGEPRTVDGLMVEDLYDDEAPWTEEARGLRSRSRAMEAVGVLLLGGTPRRVPLRDAGGAVRTDLVFAVGGGFDGVLDRGGAALDVGAEHASSSSK